MISYNQYQLLKALYRLAPEPKEPQKYKFVSVNEIQTASNMSEYSVVSLLKSMDGKYIGLIKNNDGYIHMANITCDGVFAYKEYYKSLILFAFKNFILPAIVSIICSLIVMA